MIKKIILSIYCCFIFFYAISCYAQNIFHDVSYQVCFTPGGNCTSEIISEINQAQQTVRVQAYSFTSVPIARSLVAAKLRGVDVSVILDKSQEQYPSHAIEYLVRGNIPLRIDTTPAIAHNKVMIIDNKTVITGSFNFTYAAQQKNAENVLMIHDRVLAEKYANNWRSRYVRSVGLQEPTHKHSYSHKHKDSWDELADQFQGWVIKMMK